MLDLRCVVPVASLSGLCLFVLVWSGCQQADPHSDESAEPTLLRASSVCLGRIAKLEEKDERPSDGDHYVLATLEVIKASGHIPETLYLVIDYGGHMPVESYQQLEGRKETMVLRHDSLKVGERHWFVFSEDYDSSKYPYRVAGWWRYRAGDVPYDVVDAVEQDRFAAHPVWDKSLNVVYDCLESDQKLHVRVREADSLAEDAILFDKTLAGKLESLSLSHWPVPYEMDWTSTKDGHFVVVMTIGELAAENEFKLPAGKYRIKYAYDLKTGKLAATWIAKNQEIWLMQAFRQYDLETGKPTITMEFDLLDTGGITAGGKTENWYRRVVKAFDGDDLVSKEVFRHEYIKTGREPVYSGSGWLPVEE